MKTNNYFFIFAAVSVLGYLHLLTQYVSRVETHVSQQQQQHPPQLVVKVDSILNRPSRLTYEDARGQMEQANQTVLPLVQPIPGNPIPTHVSSLNLLLQDRAQRVLYIITPTHARVTQRVDLTRLRQTLQLASLAHHANIYWILIEDAPHCSQAIRSIAQESGLAFAHKAIPSPQKTPHRGLVQRNLGLETVLEIGKEGVIYFGDDDNAFDTQLFTELTYTRHTSIFAVGMSGGSAWERCRVNATTGQVDAILSTWKPRFRIPVPGQPGRFTRPVRKFGMDMAGFAFSTSALLARKARFLPTSTAGMLETDFLSQLVESVSELEPLAANCTRILAWHVKTEGPKYFNNPEVNEREFELMKRLV